MRVLFALVVIAAVISSASAGSLVARLDVDPKGAQDAVLFSITNPSSEPVWVDLTRTPYGHPSAVSDQFDVLPIGTPSAHRLNYIGLRAKRVATNDDYMLIKPNQTYSQTVVIGPSYGMTDGKYSVTCFGMVSVLPFVAGQNHPIINDQLQPSSLTIRTNNITLQLSGYILRPAWYGEHRGVSSGMLGISYSGCSNSTRLTMATNAIAFAKTRLVSIRNYLASSCDSTYINLFGQYAGTTRWSYVSTGYQKAQARLDSNDFGIDCSPSNCASSSTYAYVYPYDFTHTIHLCNKFWVVAASGGWDTQWGTIIHELSHFWDIRDTDDHTYGISSCRSLAISNPSNAIANADNYEYFAESLPVC